VPSDPARAAVRVLGAFGAVVDGREVTLAGRLQRAVLARILVGGDTMVTADQIVTDVWGYEAGRSTAGTVHAYVSRVRRLLGENAIPRGSGGYVLDRSVVTVDADAFTAEVDAGRRALARNEDAAAAAVLESALDRWQGPQAFGGMTDLPFLAAEITRLQELRVTAAEMLADVRSRHGSAGEGIELLEELAARDPLRESLAARLVRSLYAAGRQADALAAFDRCRRALAEQLGVDPAPELKEAYAAVLAQEEPGPGSIRAAAPPVNLPPRNRAFVGRASLLDQLCRSLDDDNRRPRAVVLTGLAGTGKTETALELAYRRRREGRLAWWIAAEDPTGVAAGLADLASALGIARKREQDTWAELWYTLDRTPGWVLVYDNVDEPGWLGPFLPSAVHGDVVITSRNPAWRRLAHPVLVPPMDRRDATTYVTARSGDPDRDGADALSGLLGDLPLALEQACAYIEQTGMAVHDYVRLFRQHRATLLMREIADGPTVATTWGLAFDRLRARSPLAATVLETMSFLSADAITMQLLTPLVADELDLHDALAELLRLSLIDRQASVVRVHRLVQDVVRARLPAPLGHQRLAEATRLCVELGADPRIDVTAHVVQLAAHGEGLGTVPAGLLPLLATAAHRYAERALYPAAEQILRQALRLVDLEDAPADPMARGALVCQLGEVLDASGRLSEALQLHQDAVRILESMSAPDDVVLAHAYNRLGHVLNCADRRDDAIAAHEQAIATLRSAGRHDMVAPVLVDLGYTLWGVGRLDDADQALRTGRNQLEQRGRRQSRLWAHATAGLGMVAQDQGDLDTAVACQRTSIDTFTRVCGAAHPDTAQAFDKLGYTLRLRGEAAAAVEAHLRAVGLLERVFGTDDPRVAMTLTNLGLAYADVGRGDDAVEAQARAHAIFLESLGPDHASTLLATRRWAVALMMKGELARARAMIGRTLQSATASAGSNAAERARIEADAALVLAASTSSADERGAHS
jgi:DNA-binding SARP family transcriptional activator